MLSINNITYIHPNKELLFKDLHFSLQSHQKVAIVGNNGCGKSTLLKIIAGELQPAKGQVSSDCKPYYVPQHFGQYDGYTLSKVLGIDKKLKALKMIEKGQRIEKFLSVLNDDWNILERSEKALAFWGLQDFAHDQKMEYLSGGEKTKVFLSGLLIHNPEIILMDEPTNHLDLVAREKLYSYIHSKNHSLVIVSHDRTLLEIVNPIYELSEKGLVQYGGNYSFYKEQKEIQIKALYQQLHNKKVSLKTAKKKKIESVERKNKLDARGKKKSIKEGIPKVVRKSMKNKAEKSTGKLKDNHDGKIDSIRQEFRKVKEDLPAIHKIKIDFEKSHLHKGKVLVRAEKINFGFNGEYLWKQPLDLEIYSGERICIKGANGSGKTTLIKLITGHLQPQTGMLTTSKINHIYVDQDYSLINNDLTVYQQAEGYNYQNLPRHEIGIRLNRYLFHNDDWIKSCSVLSGGEKLRLILCCMMISSQAPDLFILDEPTNNLDLENIEILTKAIVEFSGTLIVISHDKYFLKEINIHRDIYLK